VLKISRKSLDSKNRIPDIVREYTQNKKVPARPLPLSYMDELEIIWGNRWGAQSEIGKLREVLVIRPGDEVAPPEKDLVFYQFEKRVNVPKVKDEFENLIEVLRREGVKVYDIRELLRDEINIDDWMLREPYGLPHARFGGPGARDVGLVINGGAIIGRMSLPYRRGEEFVTMKALAKLGVPIIYTVNGKGIFEGGNVVWLDPKHVVLGKSVRTNQEGIDQVSYIMRMAGVEEIYVVPIPGYLNNTEWPAGGFAHLDCVFGYVDDGLAVVYPAGVPYEFIEYLQDKEINLIEVPPEEARWLVCNTFALEPGKIILPREFPETIRLLEKEGVDVIEIPWEETKILGGGPHCSTFPLVRDPGPKL